MNLNKNNQSVLCRHNDNFSKVLKKPSSIFNIKKMKKILFFSLFILFSYSLDWSAVDNLLTNAIKDQAFPGFKTDMK